MPTPPSAQRRSPRRLNFPLWAGNLTGLILLALIVLAIFTWQQSITRKNLQKNSFGRSRMVAGIIEQHITNAGESIETIDTLVSAFLLEKAGFIAYLDAIDHLQGSELEALAGETGLLGISISRKDGSRVSAPDTLGSNLGKCEQPFNRIRYDQQSRIGMLSYADADNTGSCITIGLNAEKIIDLREKTSLPVLFEALSSLPGIHYVRLDLDEEADKPLGKVKLLEQGKLYTAESRIRTDHGILVVGLDAKNFIQRRSQLRKQFILLATLLFLLSIIFSWVLFKKQMAELQRTRDFERMLADERETAALGRATATIAHEVRNPLNAINIGLQRLVMESDNLKDEQLDLIHAMGEAVTRTGNIVSELQRFTRKLNPQTESIVAPIGLIRQQITLYSPQCEKQGITLHTDFSETDDILGDKDLFAELLENILKNSIEAQENGGHIAIRLHQERQQVILTLTNGGFTLSEEEAKRIGEPYFTTKTRGSGLGLAICKRIAEAHNWEFTIHPDRDRKELGVTVRIPIEKVRRETKRSI